MINVCPTILERMSPIEILRPRSGKNLKFKVQKNVQEGIMMAIFLSNSTWKICVILSRQAAEQFGLIDSKSTFFVQNLEYIETISDIPLFKIPSSNGGNFKLSKKNESNCLDFSETEYDIISGIQVEEYIDTSQEAQPIPGTPTKKTCQEVSILI